MVERWSANIKRVKALIIIIILIMIPVVLRYITLNDLEKAPTICIYKNMTGRDCWGCGTSRAVISVLHCQFKQAYAFNKRIVIVFPLLVYLWIKRFVMNLKVLFRKNKSTTNLSYN